VSIILSTDQLDFRNAARALVNRRFGADQRRTVTNGGDVDHDTFWRALDQLGAHGLTIPESRGGPGGSWVELGLLLEETGAVLARSPFFATSAMAAPVLVALGVGSQVDSWLANIAAGELTATVALPVGTDPWRQPSDVPEVSARQAEGAWTVDGVQSSIIDGSTADLILTVAKTAQGSSVFAVPRDAARVVASAQSPLDPSRPVASVQFTDAPAVALTTILDGDAAVKVVRDIVSLAMAAEQLGGAQRALDMALQYAGQRFQHGQAIGSFQAIKHMCADQYLAIESARASVYHALSVMADPSTKVFAEVAVARLSATRAFTSAAELSIQIHGGIGFDWEHECHMYLKRAKSSELALGPVVTQKEALFELIDRGADGRSNAGTILPAGIIEETADFRASVRDFLKRNLPEDWVSLAALPADQREPWISAWRKTLVREGMICVMWPAAYGGQGRSLADHVVLTEEFVRAGVPMQRQVDILGMSLLGPTLLALGSEDQRRQFLPGVVSGDIRWCQGFSEPGAGSDLAGVETFAELRDGTWFINGQKIWTTSAHEANWIFVLARTNRGVKKQAGLTFLLVPLDQPGIEVRTLTDATGRPHLNQVYFSDATTAQDQVVGEIDGGWTVANALLGFERGDSAVRDSLNMRDEFWRVLKVARECGAVENAAVRQLLTDAYVDLEGITNKALRGLAHALLGELPGPEASLHKLHWSEYHQRMTTLAIELLGQAAIAPDGEPSATLSSTNQSNAPSSSLAWMQNYIAARAGTIYAGTSQIQRNVIAERVLAMPRSPRPV